MTGAVLLVPRLGLTGSALLLAGLLAVALLLWRALSPGDNLEVPSAREDVARQGR